MERQIPKNVRQIGNVSDTPKIYVEDYVDTFFLQLCEKAGEDPVGAFLVGDFQKSEEEEYVYIYGAIRMRDLKLSGTEYIIDDDTWKRAYEDCKQYFEEGEMLGWFVAHERIPLEPGNATVRLHKKAFPKANTIFIIKDPTEKDEAYFVHKLGDLMEIGGHYTYYEKNPCMQNYMISSRKKNGVSPSETVEDQAIKDFRSLVRARGEEQMQRRTNRIMYAMSSCLVLLVVIMGVATMNNFDKMKSVQATLEDLSGTVTAESEPEAVQETSGTVEAVTGGDELSFEADIKSSEGSGQEASADEYALAGGNTSQLGNEEAGNRNDNASEAVAGTDYNGSNGVYVVEKGDTLAMISRKIYGDISHVDAICSMNGISDGNLIYVGQKLLLP